MDNKTIRNALIGMAVAMAFAVPGAMAATYNSTAVAPGGVGEASVLSVGLAACDTTGTVTPAACNTGGLGGAIFDVSGDFSTEGTISGTCTATKTSADLGTLDILCGSDRDDNGFVTNVASIDGGDDDFSSTGAGTHEPRAPDGDGCVVGGNDDDPNDRKAAADDCFDDMGWTDVAHPGDAVAETNACFSRDAVNTGAGDDDWDTLVVFLGGEIDTGNGLDTEDVPYAGFVNIELVVNDNDPNECPNDDMA